MNRIIAILGLGACIFVAPAARTLQGQVFSTEGKDYPEENGWLRSARVFPSARWLNDGWILFRPDHDQEPNVCGGESDYYRTYLHDLFGAERLFVEWRCITDGSDWPSGPIRFGMGNQAGMHFGADVSRERLRVSTPAGGLTTDSEPDVPHTYRLDLYEGHWFEWTMDGKPVIAGRPGAIFLRGNPSVVWGVAAGCTDDVSAFDYFRVGVPQSPEIACDEIDSLEAKCRNGRIRVRLESRLDRGTRLTLSNDGVHRSLRVDENGRAKVHFRDQTGDHTLVLLECPAISREVACE